MNNFEKNLSLNDVYLLIRINIKLILFLISSGILISAYLTYTTPPVYRATAAVIIKEKPGSSMVMSIGGYRESTRMTNEIQLVQSRRVAKEVVKRLWQSDFRNSLNIFGTRIFYPKGERIRRIFRELLKKT